MILIITANAPLFHICKVRHTPFHNSDRITTHKALKDYLLNVLTERLNVNIQIFPFRIIINIQTVINMYWISRHPNTAPSHSISLNLLDKIISVTVVTWIRISCQQAIAVAPSKRCIQVHVDCVSYQMITVASRRYNRAINRNPVFSKSLSHVNSYLTGFGNALNFIHISYKISININRFRVVAFDVG